MATLLRYHCPIQIAFACGVALEIGHVVSSTRWYWAVVTAFIVFNNTKTRTDAAIRAAQRSVGTLAGVVVGAMIAFLLRHEPTAAMLLVPVLCFLAAYFLQTSYGVMIFFLTIALALLYGLLGRFTTQLLALRLIETLVGGSSGMAAAFLIFPVYTSREGAVAFDAFLGTFRDVLEGVRRFTSGADGIDELIALSRQVDRRYVDLANTMLPSGGPWAVVTRFGHVREQLLLLLACTHWIRDLCRALETRSDSNEDHAGRLQALVDRFEEKIGMAEKRAGKWFVVSHGPDLAGAPMIPPTLPDETEADKPLTALEALDLLPTRALLTVGVDARHQKTLSHSRSDLFAQAGPGDIAMTRIALVIGSAPDALRAQAFDTRRISGIVAINNAWRVREDWTHLVHAGDFPEARKPPANAHRTIVSHEAYVPSNNRFGGIVYAGGSMLFSASYWILDAFEPDIIAYCGCDMIYSHAGPLQHFYGEGRWDPLRPDPTLQSLEAKANRLLLLAARKGCLCVNLSLLPTSRLTFPRWPAEWLAEDAAHRREGGLVRMLQHCDTDAVQEALDREADLGCLIHSGDYWNHMDRIDGERLLEIDRLWLDAFAPPSKGEADHRVLPPVPAPAR